MKKQLLTLALAAAAFVPTAFADGPTIYGVTGYTMKTGGIYKFQSDNVSGTVEPCYTYTGVDPKNGGAVILEDRFLYIEPFTSYTKPILKVTRFTDINDSGTYSRDEWIEYLPNSSSSTCLALDPISKKVYGVFFNEDKTTYYFGTLDPETGFTEKITDIDLGSRVVTLVFNDMGVAYAINLDGKLFKGNSTGLFTEVGKLSISPRAGTTYACGAAFDNATGTLYWSVYDTSWEYKLCTIDVETCEVTVLDKSYSATWCYMMIPEAAPADNAPVAISDLAVSADGFSTDLTVSFTVPDQTVGGSNITAGLSAYVAVDGVLVEDGSIAGPGEPFSKTYSVSDGAHTIAAWVSTRGASPVASTKVAVPFFAGQDTPAAVSDLAATKGDGKVTLTWTAPTVGSNGGNFDTNTLTYTVNLLANDKGEEGAELATGLKDCTYTYNLDNDDLRFLQFEVIPVAGAVVGKAAKTDEVVVGEDFPGAVENLTAEQNEAGNIVLSWDAPAAGANGSDYDAASLSYTVKLLPDEVLVDNLSATTYTYVVEGTDMRALQFAVVPVTKKGEGPATETGKFVVGDAYAVPYFEDFEGKTLEETFFTIINANDDAKKWEIYSGYSGTTLRITYSASNVTQDDWAITPPIKLEASESYALSYDISLPYPSWGTENIEVLVGTSPDVDAMTQLITEAEYSTSSTKTKAYFSVPADGTYYIGFHCVSPGNHGNVDLDNISLVYGPKDVPAKATDFAASVGGRLVSLSFTVPTTDAQGNDNPQIEKAEISLNGNVVKTFTADELAKEANDEGKIRWLDYEEKEDGYYIYSIVFHNAVGASEPATIMVKTPAAIIDFEDITQENVTDTSIDIVVKFIANYVADGVNFSVTANVGDNKFNASEITEEENYREARISVTGLEEETYYTFTVEVRATDAQGFEMGKVTSDEFSFETAGIFSIEAGSAAPVRYFNIQGVEVENPENGIYIKVEGNKATKVGVK